MSEVKTMSDARMKLKFDSGLANFHDGETIMVWSDRNPYKYRLYARKYASDGGRNGWITDGQERTAPYRNPNREFSDSFSDNSSFASASSGSSESKVVEGDNTRSYLNRIASAAATGATNLAANSLTTAAKKGAKAAAVIAGTAALSEALQHPEYFPDKLRPLVPVANFAVNKVGKTVLGASKNIALKYGPAIAKAAMRAGWNNIILPRITDYWNSVEPWLPLMVGAPIAAYGVKKTLETGTNLVKSGVQGVQSGTQAIMRALKPTRIEEPIDFDEKDNMSYSSSSNYSSNSSHRPIINGSMSSDLFLLTDGKSSKPFNEKDNMSYSSSTDGKSSSSSLALVSAESELTEDPWASSDSVFDDSSFYSDVSEFIPPILPPPPGVSGSLGRGRIKRRVIFLSFFRLKI